MGTKCKQDIQMCLEESDGEQIDKNNPNVGDEGECMDSN